LDLKKKLSLSLFVKKTTNRSDRDLGSLLVSSGIGLDLRSITSVLGYCARMKRVNLAFYNPFVLLLEKERDSGELSGDGAGYSPSSTKHCRIPPKKKRITSSEHWILRLDFCCTKSDVILRREPNLFCITILRNIFFVRRATSQFCPNTLLYRMI